MKDSHDYVCSELICNHLKIFAIILVNDKLSMFTTYLVEIFVKPSLMIWDTKWKTQSLIWSGHKDYRLDVPLWRQPLKYSIDFFFRSCPLAASVLSNTV